MRPLRLLDPSTQEAAGDGAVPSVRSTDGEGGGGEAPESVVRGVDELGEGARDEVGSRAVLSFVVLGKPVSQGNLRHGRHGGAYYPNDTEIQQFRRDVDLMARARMGEIGWEEAAKPEPVGVEIQSSFQRPSTHWKKNGDLNAEGARHPMPDTRSDVDKLARAVLDALTGVAAR